MLPLEKLNKMLAELEDPGEWHDNLLSSTRSLVDMSRIHMGKQYDKWDKNNDVYRGYRKPDVEDKHAKDRKEPEKMVVPVTYSQAQTFAAFIFSLYTQNEHTFELTGMNPDSHRAAKVGEALLQRDLVYNLFESKLYQLLVDVARFSMGVMKVGWTTKTQTVTEMQAAPPIPVLGRIPGIREMLPQRPPVPVEKEVVEYQGNEILSISPYRFYPDTRLPLTRFQDGEFCASEDEYSYMQLKDLEDRGVVFGIDFVNTMSKDVYDKRGSTRMSSAFRIPEATATNSLSDTNNNGTVVVTEVVRIIIPSKTVVDSDGTVLDENITKPTKYLIWYANDNRIIRFEKYNYQHNKFCYHVALYSPDQNDAETIGLADTIDQLQSVLTWFINSRITNVRKVINNSLIVDQEAIMMEDLKNRRSVIRMKPGMAKLGIDRYIKQLDVQDVTTNHLADAKFLQELVSLTTGINENMLGQFHQGRRSAREAGNVMANAAARLKMIAVLMFRSCLQTMAEQMISNLRNGLDSETLVKVMGLQESAESQFLPVTKSDLVGRYDFVMFDGTLPSEKSQKAEIFMELLKLFVSSPDAAIALGIDPKECFREFMELKGIRNPERFLLPPPPPQAAQPGMLGPEMGGQVPVGPDQPFTGF